MLTRSHELQHSSHWSPAWYQLQSLGIAESSPLLRRQCFIEFELLSLVRGWKPQRRASLACGQGFLQKSQQSQSWGVLWSGLLLHTLRNDPTPAHTYAPFSSIDHPERVHQLPLSQNPHATFLRRVSVFLTQADGKTTNGRIHAKVRHNLSGLLLRERKERR